MGLDIKRRDVKAINSTLNQIKETELADDGSYPVIVDDNTTDFYSKDKQKLKSVVKNGANTVTTDFSNGKEIRITTDMPGLGKKIEDLSNPEVQTVTYQGENLIASKGGITKEEIKFIDNQLSKIITDVSGNEAVYHKNDKNEWVAAAKPEVVENTSIDDTTLTAAKTDFKEVFEKSGKKVNIDEAESGQRLTKNKQWETNLVVSKKTEFTENGIPKQLSIELPGDYGSKGPDGKMQKRYQTLKLVDEENNIYSDRAGIRKFQMTVGEDGISLKHIDVDDAKVKTFLDESVKAVEKEAVKDGQSTSDHSLGSDKQLSHEQTRIDVKNYEDAKDLINTLKDRNLGWGAYTSIGTDNGLLSGDLGLMEHLLDTKFKDANGIEHELAYNDIKPALNGLTSRVPKSFHNDPNYKTVTDIMKNADAGKDFNARDIDKALIGLAKNMKLQGTNFMPNQFMRGPAGNVMIEPDRTDSMWKTDAKFNIPTENGNKDFYFYRDDTLYDKCYDFQDVIGDGGLITNNSTGNNRQGAINFEAGKLDNNERYYFQAKGGREINIQVENGIAYVQNAQGKKIPINDILNGRVPMPD